jgi:hydrogenase nickel incorporation protein HypA/HybF
MHEYSVAYDIYATSRKAALENGATKVNKVFVNVGELTMVNPEQVRFLFCTLCEQDPLFSDADLVYRTVRARVRCDCGYEGDEKYVCPRCGALPEVIEGREICVTNIEIEADEP